MCLIFTGSILSAQTQYTIKDTTESNGNILKLKINPRTGSAHRVYNLNTNLNDFGFLSTNTIESVSRQFINSRSKLLKISSEDLRLKQLSVLDYWYCLNYQQTYKNIPVYSAYVGLTVNSNGQIVSCGSDAHPKINIQTNPVISSDEALSVGIKTFGKYDSLQIRKSPNLTILPIDRDSTFTYSLVYHMEIISRDPGKRKGLAVFVDAIDGSVMHTYSVMQDYYFNGTVQIKNWPEHHYDTQSTDYYKSGRIGCYRAGEGTIYDYTDQSGYYSFNPLAFGYYNINGGLYGSYVDIEGDQVSHAWASLPSAVHNWTWNASNASNVYFHVDKMHNWIKSTFNYGGMDYRCVATVNDGSGTNGESNGEDLWFGSEGGQYWARSSDVVYHEYAHSLIWHLYGESWIQEISPSTLESQAMDEGLPDYFACTMNSHDIMGESVLATSRDLSNTRTYNSSQSKYWNGEVIGGACWDLRQSGIGTTYVDQLVFDALIMTPHAHGWEDFAENIASADDNDGNLNNSVPHYYEIYDAFEDNHDIDFNVSPPPPIESVTISGPSYLPFKESAICTANVSGGFPPISYQWYKKIGQGSWVSLGISSTQSITMGMDDITMKVVVTDYFDLTDEDTHLIETGIFKPAAGAELPESIQSRDSDQVWPA